MEQRYWGIWAEAENGEGAWLGDTDGIFYFPHKAIAEAHKNQRVWPYGIDRPPDCVSVREFINEEE